MFIDNLNMIKSELLSHHRSPNKMFEDCVTERLNKSLLVYAKEMEDSAQYAIERKPLYVAKTYASRRD